MNFLREQEAGVVLVRLEFRGKVLDERVDDGIASGGVDAFDDRGERRRGELHVNVLGDGVEVSRLGDRLNANFFETGAGNQGLELRRVGERVLGSLRL